MAKGAAYFAGFLVFMVLLRDGSIGGLATDAAKFVGDSAKGLKPITKVA